MMNALKMISTGAQWRATLTNSCTAIVRPESSALGESCVYNTACIRNMYCAVGGVCQCMVGYFELGRDCEPVAAPGQSCKDDKACQMYWPTTRCNAGQCECFAPGYTADPKSTSEGIVCVLSAPAPNTTISYCPLPIPVAASPPTTNGGPAVFPDLTCVMNSGACEIQSSGAAATGWEDMVLCVPTSATTALCCPNRAHTCMQPKPTSAASGETRFWYDQASGTCQSFIWDGNSPWANNFQTQEHCMAHCGGICRRGYTQVSNGNAQTCTASCTGPNQECKTVASAGRDLCCPTKSYICGTDGGKTPATGNNDGGLGTGGGVSRWKYSQQNNGQCVRFQYTGWGADYNNFATQQECDKVCSASLCDYGQPLKDANRNNQQCGQGCPSSFDCKNNVCCPKKQSVCVQEKRVGTCTQYTTAYWYNAVNQDCEQFTYTGCGGNDNNFETYQECLIFCRDVKPEPQCVQGKAEMDFNGNFVTCSTSGGQGGCRADYECYHDGKVFGCCPKKESVCRMSSDVGIVCGQSVQRWYFDSSSGTCGTFQYNGCDGNANNFGSRRQCERYCGAGTCTFGEPLRDASGSIRQCSQQFSCPAGYSCEPARLGGTYISYCCESRASMCEQPPNAGTACGASMQRYYFNRATNQCTTFIFLGCDGNGNNFVSVIDCETVCRSSACQPGEMAYMGPNNTPWTCNQLIITSCPHGFACRPNSAGSSVCCGSSDMGVCPVGERAYVDSPNTGARVCNPSLQSACPSNYLCRYSSRNGRNHCCAQMSSVAVCPSGKMAYRPPGGSSQTMSCVVGSAGCPQGYSCQSITSGQSQGFCCTDNVVCSSGEFYVDPATQQPKQCTVGRVGYLYNECPGGYACVAADPLSPISGYCCKGNLPVPVYPAQPLVVRCPLPGQAPSMIPGTSRPRTCQPGTTLQCPGGYDCVNGGGAYICCSRIVQPANLAIGGCPAGSSIYMSPYTRRPLSCLRATCPATHQCQYLANLRNYYCCSRVSYGVVRSRQVPMVIRTNPVYRPMVSRPWYYTRPTSSYRRTFYRG